MSESHSRSKRSKTGAKRHSKRDKIRAELGREGVPVTIGKMDRKPIRGRGGELKQSLRKANEINVMDPATKRVQKTEIVTVTENAANRHFVRRNIITMGAVVETKLGRVRVTSRPGQHGIIHGVLLK